MKLNMFSASLAIGAFGILSIATAQAQTTVIPSESDSTVVIERAGEPPVVIHENKDIKGMVKLPAKVETTGTAVLDVEGNLVSKTKKDCIDESWTGDGKQDNCK